MIQVETLTLYINGTKYECRVIEIKAGQLILEASHYQWDGSFITETLTVTTIPQEMIKGSSP